jgi:hypothetical protein
MTQLHTLPIDETEPFVEKYYDILNRINKEQENIPLDFHIKTWNEVKQIKNKEENDKRKNTTSILVIAYIILGLSMKDPGMILGMQVIILLLQFVNI